MYLRIIVRSVSYRVTKGKFYEEVEIRIIKLRMKPVSVTEINDARMSKTERSVLLLLNGKTYGLLDQKYLKQKLTHRSVVYV
jgi:hypothetical protein